MNVCVCVFLGAPFRSLLAPLYHSLSTHLALTHCDWWPHQSIDTSFGSFFPVHTKWQTKKIKTHFFVLLFFFSAVTVPCARLVKSDRMPFAAGFFHFIFWCVLLLLLLCRSSCLGSNQTAPHSNTIYLSHLQHTQHSDGRYMCNVQDN